MSMVRDDVMSNTNLRTHAQQSMPHGDLQQNRITSFTEVHPRYWAALETLSRLARLQPNWDSYGSRPLQERAIEAAFYLLKLSAAAGLPSPHIGPVSGGGLQFDWSTQGKDLELEVLPDGGLAWLRMEGGGTVTEGVLASSRDIGVQEQMRWFLGREVSID